MDEIKRLISLETKRQKETLMMIPSENYAYPEVRATVGSVLMHKYSEGYPHKRYYQGNKYIDEIEEIAIESAKKLFKTPHANVQPYSGSPANAAVYMALLDPGDIILGMSLNAGGHLTHGHPKITFSGKYFNSIQYGVDKNGYIDFSEVERLAKKHKPKLIIAGLTAYPRQIDFEKFSEISESVGAYLMADISHISGLVVAGIHPDPSKFAHVITTTTHKILRGPRGAIIMVTNKGLEKDLEMGKKIDRAVFPGLQGGPHDNTTAGIAIALRFAQSENYKTYAKEVVNNAKMLSEELTKYGFDLVTNGTDNHLILIDLRRKNISGREFAERLEEAGVVVNYNAIPNDPNPPFNPSGIRLGTPALAARGMGEGEMKKIAKWISEVSERKDREKIAMEVKKLCEEFPID